MTARCNDRMELADIRRRNLRRSIDQLTQGNAAAFAELAGKSPSQINDMLHGRKAFGEKAARAIEIATGLPQLALDTPLHDAVHSRYEVREASAGYALEIEFMDVMGSCGGGALNLEAERRSPLMKEPQWFKRYGLRPQDALAVWADGDSMADFIVDGDIVIFDRSKTLPRSGKIFLLEHPDGLRIKRLRQQFDRSWIMESNNPDKRRYPDELVTAEQAEHLRVIGQFVYRQGG